MDDEGDVQSADPEIPPLAVAERIRRCCQDTAARPDTPRRSPEAGPEESRRCVARPGSIFWKASVRFLTDRHRSFADRLSSFGAATVRERGSQPRSLTVAAPSPSPVE